MDLKKHARCNLLKGILSHNHIAWNAVQQINQGFYGYVYLVEHDGKRLIAKVYKQEGCMEREARQLEMLRKYALIHVPEIIAELPKSGNGRFDTLLMEHLPGVNAGRIKIRDAARRERFADQIIDNLLAIHAVTGPEGFGDYIAGEFSPSWEAYYHSLIAPMHRSLMDSKINQKIIGLANELYELFPQFFSTPVRESHLIHGDYNLWNLMVDPQTERLTGMIDPFGSCFADRELELFQLENSNGNFYHLLENYAKKVKLSDNFDAKKYYYRFWDEVKHYLNVGYCDKRAFLRYGRKALELLKR